MKTRRVWSLPLSESRLLGSLRLWPGVEVCEASNMVWLRAENLNDQQWDHCRRLPGADRYSVLDDDQLVPIGHLAPRGYLPTGPWQPLAQWLGVELPPSDAACPALEKVSLRFVRSLEPCEPDWLLVSLAQWTAYAITAPQVRLARWSFAADRQANVLVRGRPLPPLPGKHFVESHGIAVPAGWSWTPAIDAQVLRAVFQLEEGDSALWLLDGSWQRIAAVDWVQASRSAVRLTHEELQHGL